jgi:hypothetical protein
MGVIQIAGVAVTANAIGVATLVYLLTRTQEATGQRTTGAVGDRRARLLVPVVASLGTSLLLSLVSLHVATFGPVLGAVSMATLVGGALATLFVGLLGTVGVALAVRFRRSRRVGSTRESDGALDRMFKQYDAGDGDSRDGLL